MGNKRKKDKTQLIINTVIVNNYYNNQPPNNKRQSRIQQILNFFPYIIAWVYKFVLSDIINIIEILNNIFS